MAKYTSANVKIQFDNSSGSPQDMTAYVTEFNGVKINAETMETTPFGTSTISKMFGGVKTIDDVTLKGFYDDTATTGPDAIFNDVGCAATAGLTRTLTVTWDTPTAAKHVTFETIIKDYAIEPVTKQLTAYTVTLEATGAIT